MTHITDPLATDSGVTEETEVIDPSMDRFVRRYVGYALKDKESLENKKVAARRKKAVKQAKADLAQLRIEFEAHPMPEKVDPAAFSDNPEGLAEAYRVRAEAVNAVFDEVEITPVSGTCSNVSINGVVEIDPDSLRMMAPSSRKEIFDAANLENGSKEQKDAIAKLTGGALRIRTKYQVEGGRKHLDDLLEEGPKKEKLATLYEADGEQNRGGHRAFDISNKIASVKGDARVTAQAKHGAMLDMALSMPCDSLSEMVTNFEFAEMTFNEKVEEKAQVLANRNAAAEKEKRVAEMHEELDAKEAGLEVLEREELETATAFEKAEETYNSYLETLDEGQRPENRNPDVIAYRKLLRQQKKLGARRKKLEKLSEDAIREFEERVEIPVPTKEDIDAAARELADDEDTRVEMLEQMEIKLKDYTDAVPLTGNAPASVGTEMDGVDIALNAAKARDVAGDLRFGSVKAAGYHTLKHHTKKEMANIKEANDLDYDTPVKRKVAHYHICARAAVASGEVVLSQVSQNGGESHLYKHRGVTAIVWMNNNKTGLATFFKK